MSNCKEITASAVVNMLIRQFFNSSLNFSLQPEQVELLSWENQQMFLNSTVNHEIVKKYPVSSEFCRLFLKKIIQYLEPNQDVHDDFYTCLCLLLNSSAQQEFCYKHYLIGTDFLNIISIKETKNMVVNGTTGMRTWQAALMLADFFICNKNVFKNKRILELGSGVGFAGITIAKYCDISSIFLTDCHNDVIKTIIDNIKINFSSLSQESNDLPSIFKVDSKQIGVMMLDWNYLEDVPDDIVPDVVIGADIIYDPAIIKPLCDVIKTFCNRNKSLEVYIANVIRNEQTYQSFMKILDDADLSYELIPQTDCVNIDWDSSIQSCLLKIKLK